MRSPDSSSDASSSDTDLVSALSARWQAGTHPPDLQEFLAKCGAADPATLVALIRVDQRHRWQRGQRIPAESYFGLCPALEDAEEHAVEIIYGEYLLREERSEKPQVEEFTRRFPRFAKRLRQQIELHRAIDSTEEGSLRADDGAPTHKGGLDSNNATWKNRPDWRPIADAPNELPGYQILRVLGRGGMGVVYLARQVALDRLVALKMLPFGPVDQEDRARFRVEAETVARLQHPNIVQIHEIGAGGGRPYLALEYVAGGTLAKHCAGRPQPPRDAARLLETLARAIHFAHQHGVVHRDLKPANILLQESTRRHGDLETRGAAGPDVAASPRPPVSASSQSSAGAPPIPKIADFGLAKLLDRRDQAQTQTGTVLGTPSYMAPEQALGRVAEIGTPADVYALGAILYELLTGRPPFEADSSLVTLQWAVHQEPVRPRQLQQGIARDLETICLKCLQKSASAHYGSAEALADDLKRFLAGEPIQARRVGGVERVVKWARRRPALAGLLVVALLATFTLLGGGWWAYGRLRESAALTQQSFQDALDAVNEMLTEVADVDLAEIPQMETKRRELLRRAQAFYEHLQTRHAASPELDLENVHGLLRLGEIHALLGEHAQATDAYEQALARLDTSTRLEPEKAARLRAEVWSKRAMLHKNLSEFGRAEASLQRALTIHAELAQQQTDELAQQQTDELASVRELPRRAHYDLGVILAPQADREAEAELAYRGSERLLEERLKQVPDDLDCQRDLARTLNNLAILLRSKGKPDAEATFAQAVALQRRIVARSPRTQRDRHLLARMLNNLADARFAAQDWLAADERYTESRDLLQKLRDEFPSTPLYQQDLASAHHNLGLLSVQRADPEQAASEFRNAIGMRERLATAWPTPDNRLRLAKSQTWLAVHLERAKEIESALEWHRAAHATLKELVRQRGELPEHYSALGEASYNWGRVLAGRQSFAEAQRLSEEAVEHLRRARDARPEFTGYQVQLCRALTLLAAVRIQLKDAARAADAAEELPRVMPDKFEEYVRAARFLCQCAGLAVSPMSDAYALRAIKQLREALALGYKDVNQLKTEPDFGPLRARPEFEDMIKKLEARVKVGSG